MNYLKDDENIKEIIIEFIKNFKSKAQKQDIHKEVLDPFSSIVEASINNLNYSDWIEAEKTRQHQKTLQNSIGDLHQKLLSNIKGVQDLGVGEVVDTICHKKKIIAEIKNKYNTTKGNHKCIIYDDLEAMIKKPKYKGYTGYYVEIIPKSPKPINSPFTPPDNKTKINRTRRTDIRHIDGKSFYELITDVPDALSLMYKKISKILSDEYKLKQPVQFNSLFNHAYIEGFALKKEIKDIEKSKNIQLIQTKDLSRTKSLTWKHGKCEFKTQMWRLQKEGTYKCPTCKTML